MRLVLFLNFKNDLTDEPSTKHHRERGGIATNVSRLGEVGDFENETLKLLLNLN
jgi:hypothetical protein